jgi:L-ascorbate metabolism protein UlaG (beta-lactamase superfamily)
VPSYHDAAEGLTRGKNTIFIVEMDGWRFCHLGDLGHDLTPAQLKKIGEVDVLMVPVGGIYTLNGSEAKRVVAGSIRRAVDHGRLRADRCRLRPDPDLRR